MNAPIDGDSRARRELCRALRGRLVTLDTARSTLVVATSRLPACLAHIVAMYACDLLCSLGHYTSQTVAAGRVPLPAQRIPEAVHGGRFHAASSDVFRCRRATVDLVGYSRQVAGGWKIEWIVVADRDGAGPSLAPPPAWHWPWDAGFAFGTWYSRHVDEDTTLVLVSHFGRRPGSCHLFCWLTETWKWHAALPVGFVGSATRVFVAPSHIFLVCRRPVVDSVVCHERSTGRLRAETLVPSVGLEAVFADDHTACLYFWERQPEGGEILAWRLLDA